MKKYLLVLAVGVGAVLNTAQGVNASEQTGSSNEQDASAKEQVKLSASDWDPVDRQTARYPIEASRRHLSGCATVEYTLTPNNEITDVNVISASHKSFAKEAQKAVTKWNFDATDTALTSKNVEMQTKFQFCSGENVSACAAAKETVCKGEGEDVIAVVDYNVDTRDIDERARTYGSPFSTLERRFFKTIND